MKTKAQLFILADETTSPDSIKNQDLSNYSRVDLLYWGELSELMKEYSKLAKPNFVLHQVSLDVAHHINQLISRQCSYYVVSEGATDLNKLPVEIDEYSEKTGFPLLMVKPPKEDNYTGLVVNSLLHDYLHGFGATQTVMEKIDIFSKNNDVDKHVFESLEDFHARS